MGRLRFGRFAFEPTTGELSRDGEHRALQPQPARMLAALVARPGELVSREELRQALWGDDTHVDYEKGLNFCAAQIRAALGDSASAPQFIETVPKRGYRFVAAVSSSTENATGAGPAAEPPDSARRRWPIGAALVATAVLAAAVLVVRGYAARPPIVAVVPFQNETGSAGGDRIAKAISDTAVARLARPERLEQLRVVGNAAALRFTFRPPDLVAMGNALGADFILLGQLKRDAGGYRLVAHLIRVSDQTHIWANTYDRATLGLDEQSRLADVIAAEVSERVAGQRTFPYYFR